MPILRTYLCPECQGKFEVLHMTRDEAPPLECELCSAYLGEEIEPEIPHIHVGGSNIARSVDDTWNKLSADKYDGEGNLVAKGLSDMNDNLRQGDVAAKTPSVPNNLVSQYTEALKQMTGDNDINWQGASAKGYVEAGKKGPGAGESRKALSAVQSSFMRR